MPARSLSLPHPLYSCHLHSCPTWHYTLSQGCANFLVCTPCLLSHCSCPPACSSLSFSPESSDVALPRQSGLMRPHGVIAMATSCQMPPKTSMLCEQTTISWSV
ncbi:hypothetical protein FKM82_012586 [Ascaphus truei]